MKRKTTKEFIEQAKKIHGNKYDYSLVEYNTMKTKIKIICYNHGTFEQRTDAHLSGQGCPMCNYEQKSNKTNFIKKAKKIHGNKYDYSLVRYKNNHTKVKILCHIHGIFKQIPNNHISKKQGCPKCNNESKRLSQTDFIERSKNIHNNKYTYQHDFKTTRENVSILCPSHGEFTTTASIHLQGYGCPKCKTSKGEKKILKLLSDNNIIFEYQKKFKKCKDIQTLVFDFYLPDYNLCVEYDGKQHFEPIEYFGGLNTFKYIQAHDKIKTDFCKKNNITLNRISYNDYNNITLNMIITT